MYKRHGILPYSWAVYLKQVLGLEVTVNKYLHTKIIGYMGKKKVYTLRWDNLIECFKMKKPFKPINYKNYQIIKHRINTW